MTIEPQHDSAQRLTELELIRLKLGDIKPYKGNARTHSKQQIDQIAASIREFGFTNPILLDEAFQIIAGHGRFEAARKIGLETAPAIIIPGLTDARKRALRLADNKVALNSGWDRDLLKIELEEIEVELPDLTLLEFDAGELNVIMNPAEEPAEDDLPDLGTNPVSRLGDLWRLGGHRVLCGDCRDGAQLEQLMAGRFCDAAFMDPPYNVSIEGHAGGKGKIKHREFAMASGEMTREEFIAFLTAALCACVRVSRDGAAHFICMDHHHLDDLLVATRSLYGKRLNIAVWKKSNAGMGSLYRSQHEMIGVFQVGNAKPLNTVQLGKHGRSRTNVWEYASVNSFGSRAQDLEMHPTVKPVAMVADAIKDVTKRGDLVLDAFLGSGTTLIAAERVQRVCYGMEIDPVYVDLIVERWHRLTGEEPVLAETGETHSQVRVRRQAEV